MRIHSKFILVIIKGNALKATKIVNVSNIDHFVTHHVHVGTIALMSLKGAGVMENASIINAIVIGQGESAILHCVSIVKIMGSAEINLFQ
jgi:hypothetical protein